jgi:hypothetical protein
MGSFRSYLKFGNIEGEVTKPPYRFWIELKSVREEHGGAGAGDISCFKDRDSTTPRILQYSADGRAADAVIDIVRESGGVILRYEMPSAMISSVNYGNDDSESISISCEKIDRKFEPGTPPP